jgi:CMP-N-acetylneuraminic acid synthetase
MKILALIPARAGSKRLPGKNIRVLGAKPLINWSIDIAKEIPEICDTLVSTDDLEIASICRKAGALVPWLRPSELATDTASSVDVAIHALNWYEAEKGKIDGLLLLQPTSPFRSISSINKGIELFSSDPQKPVLGVTHAKAHPMWTFKIVCGSLVPFLNDNGFEKRSQDLQETYVISGSFYLLSPLALRVQRSFIGVANTPLLIESPYESLDIDSEWDWSIAEYIMKELMKSYKRNLPI